MYSHQSVTKFVNDNKYYILFVCSFILCIRILDYIFFSNKNNIQISEDHIEITLYDDKIDQIDLSSIPVDRDLHISIEKSFAQSKDMIEIIKKIQKVWLGDIKKILDAGKKVRFYYNREYLSFLGLFIFYSGYQLFLMEYNNTWRYSYSIASETPVDISSTLSQFIQI